MFYFYRGIFYTHFHVTSGQEVATAETTGYTSIDHRLRSEAVVCETVPPRHGVY